MYAESPTAGFGGGARGEYGDEPPPPPEAPPPGDDDVSYADSFVLDDDL